MSTGTKFSIKRISRKKFIQYSEDIFSKLRENNIKFSTTRYYDDKLTFGDLDIITTKPLEISTLIEIFNDPNLKCDINFDCISVLYNNFQIDFITTSNMKFNITADYYSYLDLSCILGRLFKKNNLTFGDKGLYYEHNFKYSEEFKNSGSILITDKFAEILYLVGLDHVTYTKGFKNRVELLEYVSKSQIYNKKSFETNKKHEKRIEELFAECKKFENKNYISTSELFENIENYFPTVNLTKRIKEFEDKENLITQNKVKFNGNIIMSLLPELNKTSISTFIKDFKNYINNTTGLDFNIYIYNTDIEVINKQIEEYYATNKMIYYGFN